MLFGLEYRRIVDSGNFIEFQIIYQGYLYLPLAIKKHKLSSLKQLHFGRGMTRKLPCDVSRREIFVDVEFRWRRGM